MPTDQPSCDIESDSDALVIVGASHCGVQSAFAARRGGFTGSITVIGDEHALPYHRPPLSKDVLTGARRTDQLSLRPSSAYEKANITLQLGQRVTRIDRASRHVHTEGGNAVAYTHLLLATGARPRQLPVSGSALSGIYMLRSSDDADEIGAKAESGAKVVVIGGGYIGLETAASLRKIGLNVTVIEAMPGLLQRVASRTLSEFYQRKHAEEGVEFRLGTAVTGFEGKESVVTVELDSGERLPADFVVVGIGVVPNVELAEHAGLAIDNGILVDAHARTADERIYAAGDCANGFHTFYQKHVRFECIQHANDQGRVAVSSILGTPSDYDALPWFWSDQYDVKLQIAGLIDDGKEAIVRRDPSDPDAFAVCHVADGVLVAVEAVNRPGDFLASKALIAERSCIDVARLQDHTKPLAECVAS